MWIWELEERTGKRFALQNLGRTLGLLLLGERIKRHKMLTKKNVLGYEQSLANMLLQWSKGRDTDLLKVIDDYDTERTMLFSLLRDLQKGELKLEQIVVTDDGIRILPDEPEDEPGFRDVDAHVESGATNGSRKAKVKV